MNNNPIGIFDSGLGGLTVWKQIRDLLPAESMVYLGDGKNCPYGSRNLDEIRGYAENAVEWLLSRGVKMIVVACNTATGAAIDYLRSQYPDMPFVGMEPAVKPAALVTKSGVIAVLATEASFLGEPYKRAVEKYGSDIEVLAVPGMGFAELVESNSEDTPEAYETVLRIVEPLLDKGVDKIVLGCTHYPFLLHHIGKVTEGRDIEIIDSAPAVARRVAALLAERDIDAPAGHTAYYEFHTFAGDDYLQRLIAKSRLL